MGDTSKAEALAYWNIIEDNFFDYFQDIKWMKKIVTIEIERDYLEFRRVMRETVNGATNPGKLTIYEVYEKLPENKWIPILINYATEKVNITENTELHRCHQNSESVN